MVEYLQTRWLWVRFLVQSPKNFIAAFQRIMRLTPLVCFFFVNRSVSTVRFSNILSSLIAKKLENCFGDTSLQPVIKHKLLDYSINKLLLVVAKF